jgi:hypothetical protein
MLTKENEGWLLETYPGLVRFALGVTGTIKFDGTYNSQTGLFQILRGSVADTVGGARLAGSFAIRIEDRKDTTVSSLPALYVEGVDATADRHFGQHDKSACLCSPLEEAEFREPEFQFRSFLERLVIPFLYGQAFYSDNRRWPWPEYAHGATGLLESYSEMSDRSRAADCLARLAKFTDVWPRIRAALRQKPYVKGHTPCFCPRGNPIRRCHPSALRGALQLQQDLRAQTIPIP